MLDTVVNTRHKHTEINKTDLSLSKSLQSNRIEETSSIQINATSPMKV